MELACNNCNEATKAKCSQYISRAAEVITGWAAAVEDFPSENATPEMKLDGAARAREMTVNQLRYPLYTIDCQQWNNEEFVNAKLTNEIGARSNAR